jgi:GTP-binding protein
MSIRNIAIIAHVDHGKTTLVDQMFRQAGVFEAHQAVEERVMDSNPLEKERGITILAKNTAVTWNDVKINIVDTPGHADFGGEVERILRMVDGVVLLVDSAEGPMPQTRFVTRKALELGLHPIVVVNKVDRPDARIHEVHDEVLELFMDLEATDEQLDAPFLYASGRDGWASKDADVQTESLDDLFETILMSVPAPQVDANGPFQMLISTLDYSSYVGRIAIGKIERGSVSVGDQVALLPYGEPGLITEGATARVSKLYTYMGLDRIEVETAHAGDIVALAGLDGVEIGKTITDPQVRARMQGIKVEEPTLSVDFTVNNSPMAGQSGKFVTTRQVRDRLMKELERNVALKVEDTESPDTFTVSGRGELHLTILMETMRREGYEFQVSRPKVIDRVNEAGQREEPYEEVIVEVPSDMVGTVIEKLGPRKGEMTDMKPMGDSGTTRLRFTIPARGLFGYRSDFMTDTRGEGIMYHTFSHYGPWAGNLRGRQKGVLVADREGVAVGFALFGLQERATMFVKPQDPVYAGMIVGENVRPDDMDVNVCKEKKLTNMRTTSSDENIKLEPPRQLSLELALEFIEPDELIEVTPDGIRLRKRNLDANQRRKEAKARAREG